MVKPPLTPITSLGMWRPLLSKARRTKTIGASTMVSIDSYSGNFNYLNSKDRSTIVRISLPDGAPENVVRTVTENSRTLKFISQGFEKD